MGNFEFCGIDNAATGQNIGSMIKKRHLSIYMLSQLMGFHSPQSVYAWVRGESLPSVENFYRLALVLDCRISELIVGIQSTQK